MSRSIPAGDYVEHFDPDLAHHRAWLLAVLEQLVAHEPQALEEGGVLRVLWKAEVETKSPQAWPEKPATATDLPAAIAVALPLVKEFEGCRLPAYPDPETGAEPWTIGWGSTTYKDGAPVQLAHRNSQHDGFSGIHGGNKLNSVEDNGDLYGSVADAFVAIHERVVLDQGEAQRCSLLNELGVQVDAAKRLTRLGQGCFKQSQIPNASHSTTLINQPKV